MGLFRVANELLRGGMAGELRMPKGRVRFFNTLQY
jgi:hypothetical protein